MWQGRLGLARRPAAVIGRIASLVVESVYREVVAQLVDFAAVAAICAIQDRPPRGCRRRVFSLPFLYFFLSLLFFQFRSWFTLRAARNAKARFRLVNVELFELSALCVKNPLPTTRRQPA